MSANTKQNYYQILGLGYNASDEDIKRSYKKLAVKYHPDKTPDKKHHELFIKIQEAYEILKDPVTKRKYDQANRPHVYNSYATSTFTSSSTSKAKPTKAQGYYGFYQQFYQSHQNADIAEKQRRAEEERAKNDRQNQAARAAKLAKDKMDERLKKEAEEAEERRKRETSVKHESNIHKEREMERERERKKAAEKEKENFSYNDRKRDAYRKEWENPFSHFAQQEDVLDQYFYERHKHAEERFKREDPYSKESRDKRSSQRSETLNESPSAQTDKYNQHGNDSSDPIILDDEDFPEKETNKLNEAFSGNHSSENSLRSSNNAEPDSDSDNNEFVTAMPNISDDTEKDLPNYSNMKGVEQLFSARMNLRPRQEPSRLSHKRRSVSPFRGNHTPTTSYMRDKKPEKTESASKRPKSEKGTFGFDELKNHLGSDIGNVDFSEVLESLPKDTSNGKNRKISEDLTAKLNAKRPRVAEYTNGASKSDTLHIPINKNSVKGHSVPVDTTKHTITMLDLHASPAIHNYKAPNPPRALIDTQITKETWMAYVKSIQKYQLDFLNYKRHIVQYQLERSRKDAEFFDLINNTSACFDVYQQCLERDFKVIHEYTELFRVFTNTMGVYKQNCNWVKLAGEQIDM